MTTRRVEATSCWTLSSEPNLLHEERNHSIVSRDRQQRLFAATPRWSQNIRRLTAGRCRKLAFVFEKLSHVVFDQFASAWNEFEFKPIKKIGQVLWNWLKLSQWALWTQRPDLQRHTNVEFEIVFWLYPKFSICIEIVFAPKAPLRSNEHTIDTAKNDSSIVIAILFRVWLLVNIKWCTSWCWYCFYCFARWQWRLLASWVMVRATRGRLAVWPTHAALMTIKRFVIALIILLQSRLDIT